MFLMVGIQPFPSLDILSHFRSSGELPLPERLSFWVCSQFIKQKKSSLSSGTTKQNPSSGTTTKRACKPFIKGQKQRPVSFPSRIRFIQASPYIYIPNQLPQERSKKRIGKWANRSEREQDSVVSQDLCSTKYQILHHVFCVT